MKRKGQFGRRHWGQLLFTLGLCACSSGGSGDPSGDTAQVTFTHQMSFVSASSVGNEGSNVTLQVRLTTGAAPTTEELTVTLRRTGGSATQGIDFSTFNGTVLRFPIGSRNGDIASHVLALTQDAHVESALENVTLDLVAATGADAGVGGQVAHDVQIQNDDLASLRFVSSSSSTADETQAPHNIDVRLILPSGASLQTDIEFNVSDSGTGSALSGIDYDTLSTNPLQFNAGSTNNSVLSVGIGVRSDLTVETDETVALSLSTSSGSAQLTSPSTHTMTIMDDDVAGSFVVSVDNGPPLGGGENFDLGTATVGAGPTAGIQLQLSNSGGSPVSLSSIELNGDAGDFSLSTSGFTSGNSLSLPTLSSFPAEDISAAEAGNAGRIVNLDTTAVGDVSALTSMFMADFPLPDGGDISLQLERLPSPWATDARVDVNGQAQAGGPQPLTQDLSLWRGKVLGAAGSRAFLSLSPTGTRGWIQLDDQGNTEVHMLSSGSSANQPMETRVVWANPAPQTASACSGSLIVPGSNLGELPQTASTLTTGLTLTECRLAIETDYQLFQKMGSSSAVTTYVTQLVAAVSERYERDVQVRLTIAYLGIHTTSNDGWSSQDSGGNTADLLAEFRASWVGNWPVTADLAHFLSGANLGGGIAYLNVLCNNTFGFGVSGNIAGNINWSTWDYSPTSLSWDFIVLAHELGHNFGANHTHEYCPPLDNCYAGCQASGACSRGTIMSYCHVCGGMGNLDMEFHPFIANRIRQVVDNSCLGAAQLPAGASATFQLQFDPHSSVGAKASDLSFTHDAATPASPFTVTLTGTAQ